MKQIFLSCCLGLLVLCGVVSAQYSPTTLPLEAGETEHFLIFTFQPKAISGTGTWQAFVRDAYGLCVEGPIVSMDDTSPVTINISGDDNPLRSGIYAVLIETNFDYPPSGEPMQFLESASMNVSGIRTIVNRMISPVYSNECIQLVFCTCEI